MNSMTKKLPIIITASTVLAIGLAIILYQGGYISELKQTIKNKDAKIVLVTQERDEAVLKLEEVQQELQLYKDSVAVLHIENQQLHAKIVELKGTIAKLNKSIQKHDDKVASLTEQINRLKESGSNYQAQIKSLELQRDEQLQKMEEIDRERISLKEQQRKQEESQLRNEVALNELNTKIEQKELELPEPAPQPTPEPIINQPPGQAPNPDPNNVPADLQAAIKLKAQGRLNNIVQNTSVSFKGISLRNRDGENELKRIKSDEWRYTYVDFDLSNADQEAIMDEQFILQLYDLDNKAVVPFNEKNPAFPNSEMGAMGYKFKYEGKPVSVRYINTQPKEGSNYELRLVYPRNGVVFTLVNGTKRIVEDGKVAGN
jgi:myosin heavy subunit